ncbi:uncharacterized protein BCR38DRAFT_3461 [Pseudomassariella vexata]|uniref:Uncharacterized protein n=1 Tax=Pseudomassariella vexata TaxID=1141098 RepID=A0A1Y2EHP0_9PEZI|nr:uncharacterized protein BCR38DRAFT_3461 [Pseudomassariella vexata]ORY71092.1 hypothetical protein BCR38DRAFT_3461 [Pseudomassariella vexata]
MSHGWNKLRSWHNRLCRLLMFIAPPVNFTSACRHLRENFTTPHQSRVEPLNGWILLDAPSAQPASLNDNATSTVDPSRKSDEQHS